jgi:hypothetical protein
MALEPRQFEVALAKPDGTVSIVMMVRAGTPEEASDQARKMLKDDIVTAIVRYDGVVVDTIHIGTT